MPATGHERPYREVADSGRSMALDRFQTFRRRLISDEDWPRSPPAAPGL